MQTLQWLTFLAKQMQQHNQTVFYLEHLQPDWLTDRGRRLLYRLSIGLLVGLVFGLLGALLGALVFRSIDVPGLGTVGGWLVGLVGGLVYGLLLGLRGRLLFEPVGGLVTPISSGEVLTWSWRQARQRIAIEHLYVPLLGLFIWLVGGPPAALLLGLLVWLLVWLLRGLSTNQLDERLRLRPNQGIWRSAQMGLLGALLGGLVSGLFGGLLYRWPGALSFGLVGGLAGGLGFGPVRGGLGTFLQHFTLRFWLWRTGFLPWNIVRFLDEAAERLLLRRVGGGYIFIHRLLLDYFASLEKKES